MSIFEYDEEKHMKQIAHAGEEKGKLTVIAKLIEKNMFSDEELMELAIITKEQLDELKQQLSLKL